MCVQVKHELNCTFNRLYSDVLKVKKKINEEAEEFNKQSASLCRIQDDAKALRNKAQWLTDMLASFTTSFLLPQAKTVTSDEV